MADSAFLQMPLHLLSMVLSQLDSIQSLGSAVLSHSSFYAAFQEIPDRVMSAILVRQISPKLRAYALSLREARRTKFGDGLASAQDFIASMLEPNIEYPSGALFFGMKDLDPSRISELSRTHRIVEYFTHRLIRDTMPHGRDELGLGRAPSEAEIFRIQRALYRFELYCSIGLSSIKYAPEPDEGSMANRRDMIPFSLSVHGHFFTRFPPWVNEQLACIHDYLEQTLSQALEEISAHDVSWGYKSVDWVSNGRTNGFKQAYLSCGLEFLFQLDRARTYEERAAILQTKGQSPPYINSMLASQLKQDHMSLGFGDQLWPRERLGDLSLSSLEALIGPEFDREIDGVESGPFRLWAETHRDYYLWDTVDMLESLPLRRFGYVFWDSPAASPVDQEKLRSFLLDQNERRLTEYLVNQHRATEKMRRSWLARASIYRRGGRGYWSAGDLSRVVWTRGG